jgi:gluconate kinase
MLQNVIIVNGAINSGKSTVAQKLANIISDSIFIEGDELGNHDNDLEKWIPTVLQAIVQRAKDLDCRNMFVAFPLRHKDWEYLQQHLNADLICVTLSPPMNVALSTRNSRQLEHWERNRIQEMYYEGYHEQDFSHLIHNNEHETPEETARYIKQFLAIKLNKARC